MQKNNCAVLLRTVFNAGFALFLLPFCVVLTIDAGGGAAITALLLFLCLYLFGKTPGIEKLSEKTSLLIFGACMLLYTAALLILANAMSPALPFDTDVIYRSAACLLKNGDLSQPYPFTTAVQPGLVTLNDYFCRYPNNIPILMLVVVIYAVFGWTGYEAGTPDGQALAISLTVLALAAGIVLFCLGIYKVFKTRLSLFTSFFLCALFVPFYYTCANFLHRCLDPALFDGRLLVLRPV